VAVVEVVVTRTIVVLSARMGAVLPAAALPALRAADHVWAEPDVPAELVALAGADPRPDGWHADAPVDREVLLTMDPSSPRRWHADEVITTSEPAGAALLDAVQVMDRLRSPGGCPWDAEQTHASLLQYLIEECYELHQAVEDSDRAALREELGDVLLQVLFHARLAAEGAVKPFPPGAARFDVDDVAEDLVRKLVGRHPHVFAAAPGGPTEQVRTASDQERRWDELKREEKSRDSALDGVALGQPAVALLAKLVSRARRAGVPEGLLRQAGPERGRALYAAVVESKLVGDDPEQLLRASARAFDQVIRATEDAARAAGLDPHRLSEADWERFWARHTT
jgi:NTP pyrophosphatase (non-canonical NTP hydrolase)